VKGEEAVPGEVEGAEACQSWPLWIWILALLIYFAAFLWRTFDKFKEQVEKREIRWGLQAVFAAAAFFFWYFFDFCREYWWFVIIALVGGAAVYLAYLCLFRREIREKSEKIETGEK
jgi:O-antigen/teichoic acid export membrane protein